MSDFSDLVSHLRTILYRVQLLRDTGALFFVQMQSTRADGSTQTVVGLLSDIGLLSEIPGVVGLQLKLHAATDTSNQAPAKIDLDETSQPWLTLDQLEANYLTRVLAFTKGNKQHASRILGIDRTTVNRKIRQYQIDMSAVPCACHSPASTSST